MSASALRMLRGAAMVLWDFDGVIKDSVDVKTRAFVRLFEPYGARVAAQVKAHHEANGGMSRFEKFPLYLRYAGEEPTPERVRELCDNFGDAVRQAVIESPWVAGVESYLRTNVHQQIFVVVSATPHDELEQILCSLDIRACFADVFGAPVSKTEAIRQALVRHEILAEHSVMIGDARADWDAANANNVPFLLRRHATNQDIVAEYQGLSLSEIDNEPS